MAKSSGLAFLFWLHGALLSGDIHAINQLAGPRGVLPGTGIDSAAMERLLGPASAIADFNAFLNIAAGQAHATLSALPTTDLVALITRAATIGTPAVGDPAWGLVAKQINYDPTRGADGGLMFAVQLLGAAGVPLEDLLMLTAGEDTVASGAAEGTSLDQTAIGQTANGGIGYLEIRDVDAGTAAIAIEDSPDNSAWATLLTFAANGGTTPIGERKTVTGAVDQWIHNDIASGFTNLDFAMAWRRGTTVDDVDRT